MDFNELLHKLEGMRVINRQLTERLEEAQKQASAFKEFAQHEKSINSGNAYQFVSVGNFYQLYTMDFVDSAEILRNAIDVLSVYDGIQFLTPDGKQSEAVLRLAQVSRGHKFPDKTFTTRRNSKGVIVWRID